MDTHICKPAVLVSPYDGVVTSVCNHAMSLPCNGKPGHTCLHPCRIPARLRAAWIHLFTRLLCSSATSWQPVLRPSATTRQRAPTYSHACNVPELRHTRLHYTCAVSSDAIRQHELTCLHPSRVTSQGCRVVGWHTCLCTL